MAERLKAAVLKTANPQGFVGSNPTPSATSRPRRTRVSAYTPSRGVAWKASSGGFPALTLPSSAADVSGRTPRRCAVWYASLAMIDLEKKIALILSEADPDTPVYRWHGRPWRDGMDWDTFLAEPGQAEVSKEQILVLEALYAQCHPDVRSGFVSSLVRFVTRENADVVTHALAEIGKLDALESILGSEGLPLDVRGRVWDAIAKMVGMEPHRLAESDLRFLESLIADERERYAKRPPKFLKAWRPVDRPPSPVPPPAGMTRTASLVQRLRYERLRDQLLEGDNPEINADREELVTRMQKLGFRKEISDALYEIDRRVGAATTPLEFKGCMDLARTVFEEIVEDAAKAAARVSTRPLPTQGPKLGNFQPWYQYLEGLGVLTRDEAALAQTLYNYLSNAGSHRLGSAPEQVRVSKNMVIEFGLMMVGRVQALKGAPTSPSGAAAP